jgi:hypothetical protein
MIQTLFSKSYESRGPEVLHKIKHLCNPCSNQCLRIASMLVFCPFCNAEVNGEQDQINRCSTCEEHFVPVKAFCMVSGEELTALMDDVLYRSSATKADGAATLYSSPTDYKCECTLKTGVRSFRDEGIQPFCGYYVVKLQHFKQQRIYHGTNSDYLDSIARTGLRVPDGVLIKKRQGFESEGLLRYAGIDKSPAEHHGDSIVELDFSGWVAVLDVSFGGDNLNRYLKKLPGGVCGIEFWEHGRALALAPHAVMQVVNPKQYMDAPKPGWREQLCQSLRACAFWR